MIQYFSQKINPNSHGGEVDAQNHFTQRFTRYDPLLFINQFTKLLCPIHQTQRILHSQQMCPIFFETDTWALGCCQMHSPIPHSHQKLWYHLQAWWHRAGWLWSPSDRLHQRRLCWRCRWPEVYNQVDLHICWSSKKQNIFSHSMMEAEVIAGSFSSVEGTWLLKLGKDFNIIFKLIPIFTDNESFISFCKNEVNNNWTKHIDIHYHYTKNEMVAGNIILHHIPTANNPADILTKPLSPHKHQHLLHLIGICWAWWGMLW